MAAVNAIGYAFIWVYGKVAGLMARLRRKPKPPPGPSP